MCYREQKLHTIDNMKVLCMLLVILGHACAIYTNSGWGGILPINKFILASKINFIVATFHTQAFVAASGYLFHYLYVKKKKYINCKKDIKKRAVRLLLPYGIMSFFWAIPFAFLFEKSSIKDIMRNYVLMIAPAQLWFLPMLFGVWCFFRLTYDKIKKIPVRCLFSFFLLIYWGTDIISGYFPIAVFQIKEISKNLLFFLFGHTVIKT